MLGQKGSNVPFEINRPRDWQISTGGGDPSMMTTTRSNQAILNPGMLNRIRH